MVSVKSFIGAGAVLLLSSAAYAADLGGPPPAMQYQAPAPVAPSGWYLRGDIGVGVQNFSSFDLEPASQVPSNWTVVQKDIQDTTMFGMGVGYAVNSWLRFDVTGEYRTQSLFHATGSWVNAFCPGAGPGDFCFDKYEGNVSSAVFMANAYVDLGTWWCLTPYIGGGVGTAYNMISGVDDIGPQPPGTIGFGYTYNDSSSWDFAWNVQAGLTYNVSDNFKVDFSWRYLDMGSPQSANIFCQNSGTSGPCNYFNLKDITSQDFRIGLRWLLQPEPAPVAISTRG
jgi:opacity protein-like surface antigen